MSRAGCALALLALFCAQRLEAKEPDPKDPADAAVIVGISHYESLPERSDADDSAKSWMEYLVRDRKLPPAQLTLLRDRDATVDSIRAAIIKARQQVKNGGVLWIVFIGYSASSPDGRRTILLGVDTRGISAGLPTTELYDLASRADGQRIVVVDTPPPGKAQDGQTLFPGLQPLVSAAPSHPPAETLVVERAPGSPAPPASAPTLSEAVLSGLKGKADTDKDGKISIAETRDYVNSVLNGEDDLTRLLGEGARPVRVQFDGTVGDQIIARAASRVPQAGSGSDYMPGASNDDPDRLKRSVRAAVGNASPKIEACLKLARPQSPGTTQVQLHWLIRSDGKTFAAHVEPSLGNRADRCVMLVVGEFHFAPHSGGFIPVTYPLELGTPDAPATSDAGTPSTVTLERFPTLDAPSHARPGSRFAVQVSLTESIQTPQVTLESGAHTSAGALAMALPDKEVAPGETKHWDIDVALTAPGLDLEGGGNMQRITLEELGDSTPALFKVTVPPDAAPRKVPLIATFWHEGTFLARVSRPFTIDAAAPGSLGVASATVSASIPADAGITMQLSTGVAPVRTNAPVSVAAETKVPDLTVYVEQGLDPTRPSDLHVMISSPYLVPAQKWERLPDGFQAWINERFEGFASRSVRGAAAMDDAADATSSTATKEETIAVMRGFGRELYARFAPQVFKDAISTLRREHGQAFRSIQIYTNTPSIPWELMIAPPQDGLPETDFFGVQFELARWHISDGASIEVRPKQTLTVDHLFAVVPQYSGARALPSQHQELVALERVAGSRLVQIDGTLAKVRSLVSGAGTAPSGVIHFAGHGAAPLAPSGDYAIQLQDSQLTLLGLKGMIGSWRESRPLVFLNACEVGQAHRSAGFIDGWGPAVLDAGASGFIGGLWSLGDRGAADFAQRFYAEALPQSAPVADALRRARRGFYETGDPTYLAYVFYGNTSLVLREQ